MTIHASRRPIVAGNWKMNGLAASLTELAAIAAGYDPALAGHCDLLVCPPFTLMATAAPLLGRAGVRLGGQTCHSEPSGAFTGEISAEMLRDCGAEHVILGHSERRTLFGETDAGVRARYAAARRAGLCAVVCVGETEAERRQGRALDIVAGQLAASLSDGATAADTIVAYEPVWAIGTGLTPTSADIAEVHGLIRRKLVLRYGREGQAMRILYGGSVKPANAAEILAIADVDGALVGGASLIARDFLAIAAAYR
jgi:triosephosphate isomerase